MHLEIPGWMLTSTPDLSFRETALLALIAGHELRGEPCDAPNHTLAELLKTSVSTVSRMIANLRGFGYVNIATATTPAGVSRVLTCAWSHSVFQGMKRRPHVGLAFGPPADTPAIPTPAKPAAKPRKPRAKFKPPTYQEARDYFAEKGASQKDADEFFRHYEANGWVQGRNKPIRNWRAAGAQWIARIPEYRRGGQASTPLPSAALRPYVPQDPGKQSADAPARALKDLFNR